MTFWLERLDYRVGSSFSNFNASTWPLHQPTYPAPEMLKFMEGKVEVDYIIIYDVMLDI